MSRDLSSWLERESEVVTGEGGPWNVMMLGPIVVAGGLGIK